MSLLLLLLLSLLQLSLPLTSYVYSVDPNEALLLEGNGVKLILLLEESYTVH